MNLTLRCFETCRTFRSRSFVRITSTISFSFFLSLGFLQLHVFVIFILFLFHALHDAIEIRIYSSGFLYFIYLCGCHQKSIMCISHRLHTTFSISFALYYFELYKHFVIREGSETRKRRKRKTSNWFTSKAKCLYADVLWFNTPINYRLTFSLATKTQSNAHHITIITSHTKRAHIKIGIWKYRTIVRYDNFGTRSDSICQFVEVEMVSFYL